MDVVVERPALMRGRESHLELGRKGEDLAVGHLHDQGLTVLGRNWRCREGELDVIATDGRVLVVCEVKTRAGRGFGVPAEAVTREKRARIRRITNRWLSTHHVEWCPIRFDVISVDWPREGEPRIQHYRAAF